MKILRITLTILILTILPFIVFTLITSKTNVFGGIQSFVVLSGSMSPSIPQGSIIFTQKLPRYQKGDVISFNKGNVTVTHRVVGVENRNNVFSYQTKGDANKNADEKLVLGKDVLGKSILLIPYVGNFSLFLKTFFGFTLFIIFPTVFFIVFELNNIRKEIMKQGEKKAMEKMKANVI